ncbi:MAG: outer membrane protein transport protein, partial [Candidatus Eisenbacteria sp.]|nr:outer membrane protein transport protein [Candidatus Eisenbacteria bacterium]
HIAVTSQTTNRIAPGVFFLTDAGPLRSVFDKVGIAAYTLTEYGSKWSGNDVFSEGDLIWHESAFDYTFVAGDMQDYESRMKTYVISPVFAKEVVPGLSVGVTANFAYSHFTLKDVYMATYTEVIEMPSGERYWLIMTPLQVSDDVTGWGYGATFGVLYRATRRFSVGATVRSPMTMAYEGKYGVKADLIWGGSVDEQYNEDFELRFPTWAGGGFAYRDFLFDGLTLTADVNWTDWSTFEEIYRTVVVRDSLGEEMSIVDVTRLDWEDTVEVAVGFDYRMGRSMSLNLGYRNSPSPVPDTTYDFLMPQSAKNVIGMGVTYRQDFWRASFALEYHAGDRRTLVQTEDMNGKHVDDLLIPSLSFTYAF